MTSPDVTQFLDYWVHEGESYARAGDYDWMAQQLPPEHLPGRVLEIGCGPGFGIRALLAAGYEVLSLDNLPDCIELARSRVAAMGGQAGFCLDDIFSLSTPTREELLAFSPTAVVCWLMGAPAGAGGGPAAVVNYRERAHRAIAELAASLPSVRCLHLVDRTAMAWQAKDIGRDTLLGYHQSKTLQGLPFTVDRSDAMYRKLAGAAGTQPSRHPAMKGAIPVLASLLARRSN